MQSAEQAMTESRMESGPPVALLGVPWDSHSSTGPGAAAGVAAIRRALADDAGSPYANNGLDVRDAAVLCDAGDVDLSDEPGAVEAISRAVGGLLDAGRRPLVLGGDHAVSFPVLRAFAGRYPGLSIVHVDAHPDLYDDFEGDPLSHASPFARIMEAGLAARLVQIGIRASNPHLREQAARFGVETFGSDEVPAALTALPTGPVYLSIDLDGLDPAYAPGVKHYEPGGLTVREVLRIIAAIPGPVVGADIVELCPDRDHCDMTAKVAVKLLKEIVARMWTDG
jgi:agmatinase